MTQAPPRQCPLPLVVWFRLDYPQPRLVRDRSRARRLIERGVPVRAFVPNGTSVGPDADRARRDIRPLELAS
jgi:hypothetical protein